MAKFRGKDLLLRDGQRVLFGDGNDSQFWFDGSELRVNTTISGVDPTQSHHLATRFYVDTISGSLQTQIDAKSDISHVHVSTDITDFVEAAQDAVGNIITGAGSITINYDDAANTITISGSDIEPSDHGSLNGLLDDDHPQYILTDGSRGFTNTVSGVDPTQDYHLATKGYVDAVDNTKSGRVSLSLNDDSKSVSFGTAFADTNYTVSVELSTTDSPPSIYSTVVTNKTTGGFDVVFSGDIDSANYTLEWIARHD